MIRGAAGHQDTTRARVEDPLWYKNAVIYAVDVEAFQDSDGDGVGDFQGLIRRLPHLAELGVTCVWVLPFYPSPNLDNGYDVADYYAVDPSHGSLDDFLEFVRRAGEHGMRVITDLVVNHTSDRHPWFQASRRDPGSRFRDYYIWSRTPPPVPPGQGPMFPGQESSVWAWDEAAGEYYYHRFYAFEPELRVANPEVQEEIRRIMDFWLSMGVAGFRVDAASHMIETKGGLDSTRPDNPHGVLKGLRELMDRRRPGSVLIGESDVRVEEIADYFGEGDELNLLFNFLLDNYLFLALARQEGEPISRLLHLLPAIPHEGQWANFLRNLDELDLERLSEEERREVYAAFAPDPEMRIFGRGIRRRIAPMLGGDRRRLEMAFSLMFSLPGTPLLVYGDEIGMGEDLALPGRSAVRTPMQWDAGPNAGFSSASADRLARPVVTEGDFAFQRVNVAAQADDPDSLLHWFRSLIRARRLCPEIGWGPWRILETGSPHAFAHECEWRGARMFAVHNLCPDPVALELDVSPAVQQGGSETVLGSAPWSRDERGRWHLELPGYGYLWVRTQAPA